MLPMTVGLSIGGDSGGNGPPRLISRHLFVPIVCLTAALLSPPDICAQADPPTSTATVEVVPGDRYSMGSFGRFFWGDHYRDAWTASLLARYGVHFPVKTFVHQRFLSAPMNIAVNMPAINANPLEGYVRWKLPCLMNLKYRSPPTG